MSGPVARGYAVASTDTGHQGTGAVGDVSFSEGHPEKLTDFAYRAVHEMAVAGKPITSALYGRAPQHSYWNGSSTGGRQGLKAAQMYPRDFDGIAAGVPAFLSARMLISKYRATLAVAAGAAPLSTEKLKRLHAAAVEACDLDDGVKDGVIGAPHACRFDPASVAELSAPELAMVRSMYAPLRNPVTDAVIYPGYAAGSELKWSSNSVPLREPVRELPTVNKPGFDRPFDLVRDLELIDRADSGQLSASSTDLAAFFKRGRQTPPGARLE
jgi:feruloyl esterase